MSALQPAVVTPLTDDGILKLRDTVAAYDREQLIWSSGYLAGLAVAADDPAAHAIPARGGSEDTWTIFYATETGNSRLVAEALQRRADDAGLATEVRDLTSFRARQLGKIKRALFVIATHGVGEPAEGTEPFFEFWLGEDAPRLEQLEYSVLALGDSSYADFCEAGRQLDEALAALGASRIAERVDCDVDFADAAERWSGVVVDKAEAPSGVADTNRTKLRAVTAMPVSRQAPFEAGILATQRITGRGSSKDVRHIELDLASSGLTYLPGDSLGISPKNSPQLVDAVLEATGTDGDIVVQIGDSALTLVEALSSQREITVLNRPFLDKVAARHDALARILDNREQFRDFLRSRQIIDVVSDYPLAWQPQDFVDALRKLPPRLYSIASSPDANPDEAHLAVAVVNYELFGREHWGAASNYLVGGADSVPVHVQPNEQFRLPADGNTPIVMIGAGTGVAPYRAFVEHRREHGHQGDNWLIFGDRNFSSDFLYQLEWLRYRKEGYLQRLDVAFSRDGADKVYVQHRIAGQARRFYEWLDRGAHVYVCGDASRMAGDVHEAILGVVAGQGGMSGERSRETLDTLRTGGRYQRDVY